MSNADQLRDANPWHPMTKPIDLKHLGKLNEELGECGAAIFAYLLPEGSDQDCEEQLRSLQDELADVDANIRLVAKHFSLTGCVLLDHRTPGVGPRPRLLFLGKGLGIAAAAVSRCIIQGIDEREPVTGKLNRDWLREALANVVSSIPPVVAALDLDRGAMSRRRDKKMAHLRQWHGMLEEAK